MSEYETMRSINEKNIKYEEEKKRIAEEELEKRMNNPDIYYIVNDYRIYKHCYDLDDYKYAVYHNKQRTFRTKKEVYDIYKQEGIEDIPIAFTKEDYVEDRVNLKMNATIGFKQSWCTRILYRIKKFFLCC